MCLLLLRWPAGDWANKVIHPSANILKVSLSYSIQIWYHQPLKSFVIRSRCICVLNALSLKYLQWHVVLTVVAQCLKNALHTLRPSGLGYQQRCSSARTRSIIRHCASYLAAIGYSAFTFVLAGVQGDASPAAHTAAAAAAESRHSHRRRACDTQARAAAAATLCGCWLCTARASTWQQQQQRKQQCRGAAEC
jgi:hypothetical protein